MLVGTIWVWSSGVVTMDLAKAVAWSAMDFLVWNLGNLDQLDLGQGNTKDGFIIFMGVVDWK